MAKNKEIPTKEITIAGEVFAVTQPYAEGDTINAAEASALNQTRNENIRNNQANAIKKAKEAGEYDESAAVAAVADYDEGYEFSIGSTGRKIVDPLEREAIKIANSMVIAAIKEKLYITKKAYLEADEANQEKFEANVAALAENPEVIAEAKTVIASRAKVANDKIAL